ncbi:MAG: hypothetical protein ACPLRW_07330, partial [Moorellales bacterium]
MIVEAKDLAHALAAASRVIAKRPLYPILNNVLLEADRQMAIRATDLEMQLILSLACETKGPGRMLPPVAVLAGLTPKLSGQVELGGDGDKGWLKWDGGQVSVPLADLESYPAPLEVAEAIPVPVDISKPVQYVVPFADHDAGLQPIFGGVYVEAGDGKLAVVATDTHRMGVWEQDHEGEEIRAIIPAKAWDTAVKLGAKRLFVSKDAARFEGDGVELTVRQIAGKYPNWRTVWPSELPT